MFNGDGSTYYGDRSIEWRSKMQKTTFHVSGMHCASCAILIGKALQNVNGVKTANVNYANEQAFVEYDSPANMDLLIKAVIASGYKAVLPSDPESEFESIEKEKATALKQQKTKLYISSFLTILLLLGSMLPSVFSFLASPYLMLILSTPIQFWIGLDFYKSAFSALKNKSANMDTLIVLGTSAAYFYSVFALVYSQQLMDVDVMPHLYFETAATIITLILLGKFLETRAKSQTSEAIKKLIGLQVKVARVLKDGKEVEVPITDVEVEDILIVKPGEKIPVDGIVTHGETVIDESMVTGESMPVFKSIEASVIGSTINKNGYIQVRATKVGKDTLLSQIISYVKQAQGSKAPIQRLADTISAYFVPLVIVLATLTFVAWFIFGPTPQFINALISMIAVLIIACPCALGLATPTAIMVGTGKGAQLGILIKNAQSLQNTSNVKYVVFDKTGTLTKGTPEVQELIFNTSSGEDQNLRSYVKSLEKLSHHPLADAVCTYLSDAKDHEVSKFEDISGYGIKGFISDNLILIGTKKLMERESIKLDDSLEAKALELRNKGQTVSFVALNNSLVGLIGIADTIKDNAKSTIVILKGLGITPILLTGDNEITAKAIARQLEIDDVVYEVLPLDKATKIERLKEKAGKGNLVAMVGDGINDAPALATADIGIAMGSGTDIAIETADITLLRGDVSLVVKALHLSRSTMRTIKQNLFWAFGYNILLIPIAMGVLYPIFGLRLNPMLASLAMALSSVSVVANALRLKSLKL